MPYQFGFSCVLFVFIDEFPRISLFITFYFKFMYFLSHNVIRSALYNYLLHGLYLRYIIFLCDMGGN